MHARSESALSQTYFGLTLQDSERPKLDRDLTFPSPIELAK